MIRYCLPVITLAFSSVAMAQSTTRLQLKEANTNLTPEYTYYLAGSFNGWNPADSNYRFKMDNNGTYFLDIRLADGNYEYKITRGSWQTVECAMNGRPIANRVLTMPSGHQELVVEEWADKFAAPAKKSSATSNVSVVDTSFFIPQLNRTRRVWIYLPSDYKTQASKKFPVMYMHDGQNLFDDTSSFAGEWGLDEFMDTTSLAKSIVVGIDHGASKRLNEYNPYDNAKFGKGEGDEYVDFLVKTLKPYIDNHYRTLANKQNTGIAGSSMGGLISMYAVLKYPDVFSKVGVFSPAFWVAGDSIFEAVKARGGKVNSYIYFYGGKLEGESMVPDMTKVYDQMKKISKSKMKLVIRDDGRHNEPTWRKEFPEFYRESQ